MAGTVDVATVSSEVSVKAGGRLVKPPQSRRGRGTSMVFAVDGAMWGFPDRDVYVKTQCGYSCRPAWRLWRTTPTFLCEARALRACRALGVRAPELLGCRVDGEVTELVIEAIPGAISLPEFIGVAARTDQRTVLTTAGRMVGMLHNGGWTHGSLAGGHILIERSMRNRVWLIDFEKARRFASRSSIRADLARFRRRASYLDERQIDWFSSGYRAAIALAD